MPEYLSPGVYMEEISVGPKPIEGVGTSTAGMLGLTERGPVDPRLVTNMGEYTRLYGGYRKDSYLTYAMEGFFANGGARCFVGRIINKSTPAIATVNNIFAKAIGAGEWGNNIGVLTLDASSGITNVFKLIVAYWTIKPDTQPVTDAGTDIEKWKKAVNTILEKAQVVESYDELSLISSAPNFYAKVINSQSNLIKLTKNNSDDKPDTDLSVRPQNSTNIVFLNTNDADNVTLSDFLGYPADPSGQKTGLEAFKEVDEINIVYCPDIHWSGMTSKEELQNAVKDHCESMKDRFAILDTSVGNNNIATVSKPVDSTYAAFYYPWIKIYDPLLKDRRLVPPGGHVAGIYARSDIERGVHKAPANEIVKGAMEIEFPISKEQQAILNPKGINAIREFPGRGLRVWGARTCSSDPEWKYINVRRLFLYIEESIEKGTQWVVFEPNNEALWARVKQSITNFLTTVWRDGALMGTTPEQAFFVDIGYSTMTPADIDNGKLICMIGVAPVKPAEFVIFRIFQKTLEVK